MRSPLAPRTRRRRAHPRWLLLAGAVLAAAGALLAGLFPSQRSLTPRGGSRPQTGHPATHAIPRPRPPAAHSLRLGERVLASLAAPVQDAAAVALGGGRLLLLGGLTAADTSTDAIVVATPRGARTVGRLPQAVHDAAAVRLGRDAYLFGGGTSANTQSDGIVRVDAGNRTAVLAGHLPAPSSDQAAAVLDGTAYVVGGYTGSRWLDTVVAWRPGAPARVVAHLPTAVRYAAVTAVGGRLVIAGGSLPSGSAGRTVFVYRPGVTHVSSVGRLPAPTTHAAGAAVGGKALVIGGRGGATDSQTAQIISVNPASGRARRVGALASPRSDLAAVASGHRILLAGGRGLGRTESMLSELVPAPARNQARRSPGEATTNVYARDGVGMLAAAARRARALVYVPNSQSATVDVIDQRTFRVVEHFAVGALPQHVVPAFDLRTLYVTNDLGNSLTAIDPRTGRPGRTIPVDDPYNLYFTPDGRYAIVVAERLRRLDFRDAHTFELHRSLVVPCAGVDHMDFANDGRYLIASCEFSGQLVKVDVARERVVRTLTLPDGSSGMPQDVRVSPDGRVFYVADLTVGGVWKVDGRRLKVTGFLRTGRGAHGLYPSRDGKLLYVSNRGEGSVSVIRFKTRKVATKWWLRGGGSPDMGGVSADGKVLWLSGRYNSEVYAISTRTGRLLARIHVGVGPHGLCVWPQPGRYSLGHTDNMR
jgi:DNA-binding beta-propeller fold protein YncE